MYAFKCGDDSKNKLKGICKTQSKHIKFEEDKKSLYDEKYQSQCNNYILRSINYEMQLQEIKNSRLSIFDHIRCYITETESEPWNLFK